MDLRIKTPNLTIAQRIQTAVASRVVKTLSRPAEKIRSLEITIRDVNGPRGGLDHTVQLVLRPIWGEEIVVRHQAADAYSGVSAAIKRALRTLKCAEERRRSTRRGAYRRNQTALHHS